MTIIDKQLENQLLSGFSGPISVFTNRQNRQNRKEDERRKPQCGRLCGGLVTQFLSLKAPLPQLTHRPALPACLIHNYVQTYDC